MRGGWREWVLTTKNRDDVYYDGDFSLLELSEGSSIFLSHRIWKGGAIKFSPSKIVNFKWNSHYFFCGKKKIYFRARRNWYSGVPSPPSSGSPIGTIWVTGTLGSVCEARESPLPSTCREGRVAGPGGRPLGWLPG